MQLFVLGLNHKSAPVEVRERFAIARDRQGEFLLRGARLPHVEELLLLSTCNRVELYGASSHPKDARQQLLRFFAEFQGGNLPIDDTPLYFHWGEAAVNHGFRVAASLDSMMVGEPQILGQAKDAYRLASEAGTTGTLLNKYFHRAFHVAKKVRTETAIAANPVSISYAAMILGRQIFGELKGKKVLILGAGKMSESTLRHFKNEGVEHLYISNRSSERAEEMARKTGGEVIPFEKFEKWLSDADVVITSTASPTYLIKAEQVQEAMKPRKHRPIFFIDIAVPRNVSPEVNSLANVYLYDIDDLGSVVEANKAQRLKEADRAKVLLDKEVTDFLTLLKTLEIVPTLASLSKKFEQICDVELRKAFQKLPEMDAKGREAIQALAYAIANKILHDPMLSLKQEQAGEAAADYLNVIRKLFRLDEA